MTYPYHTQNKNENPCEFSFVKQCVICYRLP